MKRFNLFIVLLLCAGMFSCNKKQEIVIPKHDLVKYVNPMVGSDSDFSLSKGNTYPAIAVPWGMNFWTPQTGENGNGWAYTWKAKQIRGIKQTHQPSPWINDYGCFSLMPMTGELKVSYKDRGSDFSHDKEVSTPHYYSVDLLSYDTKVEVTPTDRSAMFRFTFPESDASYVVIDAYHKGSYVKVIPEERKVVGYARNNNGGCEGDFASRFVIYFDKDFEDCGVALDHKIVDGKKEIKGEQTAAYIKFKTKKGEKVHARVSSSFISESQAELNLKREIGKKDFETVKTEAKNLWNKELNKILAEGGTEKDKIVFYTALYRTMLFPRKLYEINKNNEIVHYSPYNGKIEKGYMFTDNGFWDTFRAVFPFFTVMYPEMNSQIMKGLVNTYKEGGRLPEWASPGYRDCMIGSNSSSIIADAYIKGIRDFDAETAFEAMVKNATVPEPRMNSLGRSGVLEYNKLGYVPCDIKLNESAARTLEYAYADFCVAEMAKAMGKDKSEYEIYEKRMMNYKNLFDKEVGFMRGRKSDGTWLENFNPFSWGGVFTEGCSWHYTWSVFQDPIGLAKLMGGREKFAAKLDSVFTTPPHSEFSYYGFKIHEIVEMELLNMGQYAHGNQPIQHMIYLYNWAKEPWKAQYHVRNVMEKLYGPGADGLCGDEDNGQTSAWFVFGAMGFYPVCPGTPEYAIGSPLFEKMTLSFENGKKFVIEGKNNSSSNYYIKNAKLNGKEFTKNFITHNEILNGGSLSFEMDSKPNKNRGIKDSDIPFSITRY